MDQLVNLYVELVRGANDEQIVLHLSNLVQDAAAMADAVRKVIDQARERATQASASVA